MNDSGKSSKPHTLPTTQTSLHLRDVSQSVAWVSKVFRFMNLKLQHVLRVHVGKACVRTGKQIQYTYINDNPSEKRIKSDKGIAHLLCSPSHSFSTTLCQVPYEASRLSSWNLEAPEFQQVGSTGWTGRSSEGWFRWNEQRWTKVATINGRNPANQLRLVVYPIIPWFTKFCTSQVVQDFFHQRHLPKRASRLEDESYRDVFFLIQSATCTSHITEPWGSSRDFPCLKPSWKPRFF